jgi:pseudaminic acid cytidylyltransferase
MIAYILESASRSGLFDIIHVSTDSPRIAGVAARLGFAPEFPRPAELADDHTPLMPVLRHVAETFMAQGRHFDEIWLLMTCSPLIEADDLRGAAALFAAASGKRAVLPIVPYPAPIEWAFDCKGDGSLIPMQPGMFAVRSQDLPTRYHNAGSFCIFPAERVLTSAGAGDDSGFIGYKLQRHKAIDIDDNNDWRLAELVFRGLKPGSPTEQPSK